MQQSGVSPVSPGQVGLDGSRFARFYQPVPSTDTLRIASWNVEGRGHRHESTEVSPLVNPLNGEGNRFIRRAAHTPFEGKLRVATWNVEGLSDIKIFELIRFMRRHSIHVLCIQETHILRSPYYTIDGFLVILSGSSTGGRETAGLVSF